MVSDALSNAASDADLVVADIGATNVRFAAAGPRGLVGAPVRGPTRAYTNATALLQDGLARLGIERPAACCLAIAGPVVDGAGRITNGTLAFDERALTAAIGAPVHLVNDFEALARGLPALQRLRRFGGPREAGTGVKAVLGPGSGLGMGILVPLYEPDRTAAPAVARRDPTATALATRPDRWVVLPSEGGHADLAPGTPLEAELLQLLQFEHGHVSWETVLCGPGLVHLYRAVCRLWGMHAEEVAPEWITRHGVDAAEPVCHQTLEIFCGLLGAAAGNLAVTICARGGVYIGGGILPRLGDFLAASPLRRRFEERGNMTELARAIPLYLIEDEEPGLVGALEWLRALRPHG